MNHYFRRERTRWLLIVLVVLGLLLYGALTARILEAELAGTPASSSSWHVALRNYLDVVTGSDDRDSSPTVAREDPNAYVQPDNFFDGMGWVAAALVYALVCNLFYRKYRDYLILNRGYDTDNTLDGVCAVLLLIGGIAGFLWPLAWVAAGLLFALLLLPPRQAPGAPQPVHHPDTALCHAGFLLPFDDPLLRSHGRSQPLPPAR